MKGTALVYRPGSPMPEITEFTDSPRLEFLQTCTEGFLEAVPYFETIEYDGEIRRCVAFCNEEGKLERLALNWQATALWDLALRRILNEHGFPLYPNGLMKAGGTAADLLVGPIIVLTGDEEFMDSL